MAAQALRFRRAPHVICYWESDRFVLHNFAASSCVAANPVVGRVLHACSRWRSLAAIQFELREWDARAVRLAVSDLVKHAILMRSDRPRPVHDRRLAAWTSWNPAAGFFHFSTKDVRYPKSPADAARVWQETGPTTPMPRAVKAYRGASHLTLPQADRSGEFPTVLRDRRTWREFGTEPVSIRDLATLLQLTWGVQRWGVVRGQGRIPLKTSPSGGARHPGEVYVMALSVKGLKRGLYHYDSSGHRLTPLRHDVTPRQVAAYLPGQTWYRSAAALLLMTAVFRREQWRYPFPRAYRAVLLDAGHLCQTCCLVATWLGLAPFCSMAFADSRIERDLGIDGVSESMLYVAGVGTRPARGWMPWKPPAI